MPASTTCVLLAAGAGTRFGAQKLLARLRDGRTVVEASATNLINASAGKVIAVTRRDPALMRVLAACGCQIVINDYPEMGMGSSIARGIAAVPDASGWVIALGDMPSIRVDTVAAVVAALQAGASIVVPTVGGKRGHPVGFTAAYRSRLLSLNGDIGAREIVRADESVIHEIQVDDAGILADIDTPADLEM